MASARDRVLDAYETLLIEAGPGAATLDAVAAAAGVSKGGLLYHFASKDALAAGLLARLRSAARPTPTRSGRPPTARRPTTCPPRRPAAASRVA